MTQYHYTIQLPDGEKKSGILDAQSQSIAAHQLRSDGSVILQLQPAKGVSKQKRNSLLTMFTIPLKHRVLFAINLSVMIGSGLSISRALHNLAEQTNVKSVWKIIDAIYQDVVSGTTLSDAMAKFPQMFDHLFINMVRVGEVGGNLEDSLKIIASQMEKEQKLRAHIRGAMMYPTIVLIAMIGIGVLMLTYILPQIMGVFSDMDVVLPASTQMIVNLSDALRAHSIAVTAGFIGWIIFMAIFIRTNLGHRFTSFLAIHLPIVKTMSISVNCARFARIQSSLLRSGVSVVEALTIVRDTLNNVYYKEVLDEAVEAVQRGVSLADIIRRHPQLFPILVPQMLDVGEETGKTAAMLLKVAEFYESKINQMTKNLSSIIEPLLMLVMGVAVGFFAVAMLKPMYSLMENIK